MQNIKKKIILLFVLSAVLLSDQAYGEKKREILFDYMTLIQKTYRKNVGGVIPVTIGKSIDMNGVFTSDGLYMFYSSDRERGNYDIYLRALTDITTVRVTEHASKDSSPAISPNGKYLAFVSQREDPEGDIFVVGIKPDKMITQAQESVSGVPALDSIAKNISLFQDPATKTVKIIRDDSPCWSPDGDIIAFSSARDGMDNIWVMTRKGKDLRQITRKGGMYPRFSPDGKYIIFVSYRDAGSNGDIYTIDMQTGKEKQITSTAKIELYPSFTGSNDEVIYTLIDRDTNLDGKIDLKDNSILCYRNLKNGLEYPLTVYSESSFSPVWSPAFEGVIVYSNQAGDNIDVNIIPDTGIIPIKKNARLQYNSAEDYLKVLDDIGKYLLCLERVYHKFGAEKDQVSGIYVPKALADAARTYIAMGGRNEASGLQKILSGLKDNLYANVLGKYIDKLLNRESGEEVILKAVSEIREGKNREYIPYLMEDLGNEYLRAARTEEAVKIFHDLLREYPDYERAIYVHFTAAGLTYKSPTSDLPESYIKVIESSFIYQRDDALENLISVFNRETSPSRRLSLVQGMSIKYKDIKYIQALSKFLAGQAYSNMGNAGTAKSNLTEALNLSKSTDILYYKSNVLLGRIAEAEKIYPEMDKYYALAVTNYLKSWKQPDIRSIVERLINYYEDYGDRASSSGKYSEAKSIYERYVALLTDASVRKLFGDIYNEYAPRAHVLYINAYSEWKRNDTGELETLEKEYRGRDKAFNYNEKLFTARSESDKAYIYGLAYINSKIAANIDREESSLLDAANLLENRLEKSLAYFKEAMEQISWALFIDDTFIDPVLLQGWIYQYVDLKRKDDDENGGRNAGLFNEYFPPYLLEKNIPIYERALESNNEGLYPEKEGNLHLNTGNTYFLLSNYSRAFMHYKLAQKFKKTYGSKIEEALFYYHLGYCYWQNDDIPNARREMEKSLFIYSTLSSGKPERFSRQIYYLYRFFALFDRTERKYNESIAWYKKIIDFTDKYGIKIDKARYMQEISYCYGRLGQAGLSLNYLSRADRLLKDYKDEERKYPVRIKFFGINYPTLDYDIGPDTVVFGNARIYTELETVHKKLLSASLEEEIYSGQGDYYKAIRVLKLKLDSIEDKDSKLFRDIRIRILNNIGYYYYRLQDFTGAREYFTKAWDYAADPDVDDLDGVFISALNSVYLHSFLLENNIYGSGDPLAETDSLIKRIYEYRESYAEKRLKAETERLGKEADAQKRKVREEDIASARELIAAESADKYFTLDIAAGILKYQKAELIRSSGLKDKGKDEDKAYNIYKFNENIFKQYSEAIKSFENAVRIAEGKQSKRQLVKLLLDLANCNKRTGLLEEAYAAYSIAENTAAKYEYNDLLWKVRCSTAGFLREYGIEVEGDGYLEAAAENYEKALRIIEEFPVLYSDDMFKIRSLYDDYISVLIKMGKGEKALSVSERKYGTVRLIMTSLESPDFHAGKDKDLYSDYIKRVKEISETGRKISVLLETEPESEEIPLLRESLKSCAAGINDRIKNSGSPLLSSILQPYSGLVPVFKNAVIYKFISAGDDLYAWKVYSGKTVFAKMGNQGDPAVSQAVKGFMKEDKPAEFRFIVYNSAAADLPADISSFMFIPSIERAGYYMSSESNGMGSIYSPYKISVSGTDGFQSPSVTEGKLPSDMERFSVIIDMADDIKAEMMYQRRLMPTLLVKKTAAGEDVINQFAESALYAGIKSVYFISRDMDPGTLGNLVSESMKQPYNAAAGKAADGKVICYGFPGYTLSARLEELKKTRKTLYDKYMEEMRANNTSMAAIYLNRWLEAGGNGTGDNARYYFDSAKIRYLNEDYAGAGLDIDRAVKASSGIPDLNAEAVSFRIYDYLLAGDSVKAGDLLKEFKGSPGFGSTFDCAVYEIIFRLIADNDAALEYEKIKSGKVLLPGSRLKLLLADYLNFYGRRIEAVQVMSSWSGDYFPAGREQLKAALFGKSPAVNALSERKASILQLRTSETADLKERGIMLLETAGDYDSLSPFALIFAMERFYENRNFDSLFALFREADLNRLKIKANWLDLIPAMEFISGIYKGRGRYEEALKCMENSAETADKIKNNTVLEHALNEQAVLLSSLGKYDQSFQKAAQAAELIQLDDRLFPANQLLLLENEIYLGRFDMAEARAGRLGRLKDEYLYVLDFLMARLQLAKILKKGQASEAEWKTAENWIDKGLTVLDKSPDIISRFNRLDLVNDSLDFVISYRMSRNDYKKALLLAEVKKQLNLRSEFSISSLKDISLKAIPEESVKAYKSGDNGTKIAELLRKYPYLQIAAVPAIIPVELFQKKLPGDAVAFYLTANGKDILGWIITVKEIIPLRIKDGYTDISGIAGKYRSRLILMENTADISAGLYKVLKSLEKYYKDKKIIFFITDRKLEDIPFELTGEKEILEETHTIAYIPSIISSFCSYSKSGREVDIISPDGGFINELEMISIKESGIKYRTAGTVNAGLGNISEILFDSLDKTLYIGKKSYNNSVNAPGVIYVSSFDKGGIGYNDFALINSLKMVRCVIINDADIHDVNNALFTDSFYSGILKEKSVIRAYQEARESVRSDKRYSYPSYWSGIRLYMNGLDD